MFSLLNISVLFLYLKSSQVRKCAVSQTQTHTSSQSTGRTQPTLNVSQAMVSFSAEQVCSNKFLLNKDKQEETKYTIHPSRRVTVWHCFPLPLFLSLHCERHSCPSNDFICVRFLSKSFFRYLFPSLLTAQSLREAKSVDMFNRHKRLKPVFLGFL